MLTVYESFEEFEIARCIHCFTVGKYLLVVDALCLSLLKSFHRTHLFMATPFSCRIPFQLVVKVEPCLVYSGLMLQGGYFVIQVSQIARGIYHTNFQLAWSSRDSFFAQFCIFTIWVILSHVTRKILILADKLLKFQALLSLKASIVVVHSSPLSPYICPPTRWSSTQQNLRS